ncbi:hypothetical protein FRB97_000246 [Tulasnella sp. 331]|nr:hypothetical protein FRB97_000246 [Tulasnella sp. 331]
MAGLQQPYALTILEVLLEILSKLSANDLVSSALVCRGWCAPAIETIWRTNTIKLSRLLAMLAPLVETTDAGEDLAWKLMLDFEEMTEERWTFFLENYSNRVTLLKIDIALDRGSLELLKRLLGRFGGRLGSEISVLDAGDLKFYDIHCPPLLDLLLGPKQLEVVLPYFSDTNFTTNLITKIEHRAPSITKLTVTSVDRSIDYSGFSGLKSISHLGFLSPSDYIALSDCRDLQTLHFDEWAKLPFAKASTAVPTFPSLRELRIRTRSPQLEVLLFNSITPRLHTVAFQSSNPQLSIPGLDHFLQRCLFLDDLEIKLNVPREKLARMGHGSVRRFYVENSGQSSHDSNEEEFNWIGSSFPEVRDLTLSIVSHFPKRSDWGLLASLVPVCNQLEELTLPLHISALPLSHAETLSTPPLQSLTALRVQKMWIKATVIDEFTRYLARLCPNVRVFEVDRFYESVSQSRSGRRYAVPHSRRIHEEKKQFFIENFFKYQKVEMSLRID